MKTFYEYLLLEEQTNHTRAGKQKRLRERNRRTREERRQRKATAIINTLLFAILLLLTAIVICVRTAPTDAAYLPDEVLEQPAEAAEPEPVPVLTFSTFDTEAALIGVDVTAEAQTPVTHADWVRENGNLIEDCTLTHYCTEKRRHICGTGDGVTATGVAATPYWTCAVDPCVIPYGAEVMIDYGTHVEFYQAQDCGAWINGNHIDLAVATHDEALQAGVAQADVYWVFREDLF